MHATTPATTRRASTASEPPSYHPPDPLLTPREAAAECGLSLSGFWRAVRLGRLPAPFYPSEKSPRWRRSELLAALAATRAAPVPATALPKGGQK